MVQILDQSQSFGWLLYNIENDKGMSLENNQDFQWMTLNRGGNDMENANLILGGQGVQGLKSWQIDNSILFYDLAPGRYSIQLRFYGYIYPLFQQSVIVEEKSRHATFDLNNVKSLQLKFASSLEGGIVKSYGDRWRIVFRDASKTKSCMWSVGSGRIDEGVISVFVNVPSLLEGWLVLEMPDFDKRGRGVPLRAVKVPEDSQSDDDLFVSIDDRDGLSPRELPSWVIAP